MKIHRVFSSIAFVFLEKKFEFSMSKLFSPYQNHFFILFGIKNYIFKIIFLDAAANFWGQLEDCPGMVVLCVEHICDTDDFYTFCFAQLVLGFCDLQCCHNSMGIIYYSLYEKTDMGGQ
jgi:hypothetical protein